MSEIMIIGAGWSFGAPVQHVPVGSVRPGGVPVAEPGQQRGAGELAQRLGVTGEGDAPAG